MGGSGRGSKQTKLCHRPLPPPQMCGRFALGRDRDAVLEEAIHAFQQGMNGPRNRRHRNNDQEEPHDENDDAGEEEENWDGDAPVEWIDRDDFHPRYNIAPRTRAPVLRVEVPEHQSAGKARRVLQTMVSFGSWKGRVGIDGPFSAGVSSRTGAKSTCHPKPQTRSMHVQRH